ncbi:MAG: TPM domain-containing protein, partial [Microbacterium sp.]
MIALVSGITLSLGGAATADTPSELDPGFVTDLSGVLTAQEESRLEQQLSELAATDDRPELYVILVPHFDDPDNALAWADKTAQRNNLASDQYLLAIATEGRSLAISAEYGGDGVAAGPLSESRVLKIEDQLGSDYLRQGDWAGGIEYVADEFTKVPWPWWVWVGGLAGLALIVFLITRIVLFARRRAALATELRSLEGQKKRAAQRLVQTDEAVRTSEQELGFVTAEFGEESTAEFAAVLADCRSKLQSAFQLLEKLQDAVEDTPDETRAWTKEILDLCAQVDRALEERTKKLAALRALAKNSAETLDRLKSARAEATRTQADAEARLATLAAAFPPADLVTVAGSPREIAERLSDADEEFVTLEKAVRARRPRAIAESVHEIERLLAEVGDLRDAVSAYAEVLAGHGAASAGGTGGAEAPVTLDQAAASVRAAQSSVQAR